MELTFVTDLGQSFVVEIDPNMELENVMALLEAESGIPISEQSLSYEGNPLRNPKATMRECGVGDNAVVLLRKKVHVAGIDRSMEQDPEMMRLQILGDPTLLAQVRQTDPEMFEAAHNNPARFAELMRQTRQRHMEAERQQALLEADPYSIEAQHKIEEAIQQQAIYENFEHAIEYSPEAFGQVTMLYVSVEVNGYPVKAFVDSGAQSTIMTPECAEACGIMRLVDKRFAGIAMGVGTAKIIGRVHSAQLKLFDLFLPCSFTIIEGREVDLLLGLDMLKAHQACIDLEKGVLRIQGREVRFLSEHELPEKARKRHAGDPALEGPSHASSSTSASTSTPPVTRFPGAGNTLGTTPAPADAVPAQSRPAQASTSGQSRHPENAISTLMGFGASREVAINLLDAAGGNLDMAATLLFR